MGHDKAIGKDSVHDWLIITMRLIVALKLSTDFFQAENESKNCSFMFKEINHKTSSHEQIFCDNFSMTILVFPCT